MTVVQHNRTIRDVASLKDQGSIAVLYGGRSAEREISLQSGGAVISALREAGFEVQAVDTAERDCQYLQQLAPDFCFVALHGGEGENGTWQGALELLDIPYSGSGVLGSALAMDKCRSKQIWQAMGLPTAGFRIVNARANGTDCSQLLAELGGRGFVKPVAGGSSHGMSRADTAEQLQAAIARASQYSHEVLVEQYIDGPEYTVAIVGEQCLPSIGISTQRDFYDFQAKYQDDDTVFDVPSNLAARDEDYLQQLARQAFNALGCAEWGRVDIIRDGNSGRFYLLEVNTVPGLTSHSLVPMAAAAVGKPFEQLLVDIVQLGLAGKVS